MPITKTDVLDVLGDLRLRNIRFSVGAITVSSSEYDKVADHIMAEAIRVEPSKRAYSQYIPQRNTLQTADGTAPLRLTQRSNMLHECTHAISDINKVRVARLTDEAAAYLAEVTYLLILDPSVPEPPLGTPLNNMTRQVLQLVRKYELGKSGGLGATISDSDVSSLAQSVHRLPDYSHIGEKDMLAADGVALGDKDREFYRLQMSRLVIQQLDEDMRRYAAGLLTEKVRYAAHENYITWDPELLSLFEQYARGGPSQKLAAHRKLLHIFMTVDQRNARTLRQRLSAARKGDSVSERFHRGFSPPVMSGLLAALQLER